MIVHKRKRPLSPYVMIALSFLSIVLIGTVLLLLPFATTPGNSFGFVDSFFIATSAVTITGLSPLTNLSTTLTVFGKVVLALLIQIGGLSVITISVFIMTLIGAKIGIANRVLIKESLNQSSLSGLVILVKKIMLTALIIETIGFLINLVIFMPLYPLSQAIGLSAFHAISAFNNAGFDLFGATSVQSFNSDLLFNINTALMIMLGGLGFIVIHDLLGFRKKKKLMIHTKIVLKINLILWIIGIIVFKFAASDVLNLTWLEAFFLSVSSRTAGFSSINVGTLSTLSILVLMVLMFIGASPASTGGGIKTTTLYTMWRSVLGAATGNQTITYKRLISDETKIRAFTLLFLALFVVFLGTGVILLFDPVSLSSALFETISAFANVGLSTGITSTLSIGPKLVLSIIMLIGRIGPLTFVAIMNRNWYKQGITNVDYIEEKIMIG